MDTALLAARRDEIERWLTANAGPLSEKIVAVSAVGRHLDAMIQNPNADRKRPLLAVDHALRVFRNKAWLST